MAATSTPACQAGSQAPDFRLRGTDERLWTLEDCRGTRGTLVMFICNHCPYVQAVLDRIVRDTTELATLGVKSVAIMSNDTQTYPADDFPRMQALAEARALPFPYLIDETQDVARAYGAVCTPDFFGFDADLRLRYRGRIDASGVQPAPPNARRELFEAMRAVAETGRAPSEQNPSIGCSIKWREDA